MDDLTHLDKKGKARMVDVGEKSATRRQAKASAVVRTRPEVIRKIVDRSLPKGDVLAAARLAGIMGAKKTPDLIPLCHPVAVTSARIDFEIEEDLVRITATVNALDRTGVEMEALTAVSVAALTLYDMCKSADRAMVIDLVRLDEKSGGKSGHFVRDRSGAGR